VHIIIITKDYSQRR